MASGLEILDTAVKVGLGALIGGLSTYYISKLNHDKEMEEERLRRRRELLEEIATKCDEFSKCARDYWALLADWFESKEPDKELVDHRSRIARSQQAFYDSFHDLTAAEGRLLLLGETKAQAELRAYGLYAQRFFSEAHIDKSPLSNEKMSQHRDELRTRREVLLLTLSSIYKKNR